MLALAVLLWPLAISAQPPFRPEARVAAGLGPALFDDGERRATAPAVRVGAGAAVRIGPLAGVALRAELVLAELGDATAWLDGRTLAIRCGAGTVLGELTIEERVRLGLGLSLWVGDVQQRATVSPGAALSVALIAGPSLSGLELTTELDVARLPDHRDVPRQGDVLVSLAGMVQYALR